MIVRKLTAIFLVLALIFSLTSCAVNEEETTFNGMVLLETNTIKDSGIYQHIMYDSVEKVMYTYLDGYKGGGPSVMYNKVGGVKLYTDSILSKTMLCIEDNSVDNTNLYQNTLYDSVEKAMYTYLDGYKCGGATVLYNKNGSVKFYDADSLFASLILIESGPIKNTDIYQYIMYDPVEKVMYTFLDGYNCGGPTVLYSNTQKIKCYTLEE